MIGKEKRRLGKGGADILDFTTAAHKYRKFGKIQPSRELLNIVARWQSESYCDICKRTWPTNPHGTIGNRGVPDERY